MATIQDNFWFKFKDGGGSQQCLAGAGEEVLLPFVTSQMDT